MLPEHSTESQLTNSRSHNFSKASINTEFPEGEYSFAESEPLSSISLSSEHDTSSEYSDSSKQLMENMVDSEFFSNRMFFARENFAEARDFPRKRMLTEAEADEYLFSSLKVCSGQLDFFSAAENASGSLCCEILYKISLWAAMCFTNSKTPKNIINYEKLFAKANIKQMKNPYFKAKVHSRLFFAGLALYASEKAIQIGERDFVSDWVLANCYNAHSFICSRVIPSEPAWDSDFEKVMKLRDVPNRNGLLMQFVNMYLKAKKYPQAINALNALVRRKVLNVNVYSSLGYAYTKLGNIKTAIEWYNKCFPFALSKSERKNIPIEKVDFPGMPFGEKARFCRNLTETYSALASIEIKSGNFDSAQECLENALYFERDNNPALCLYGDLCLLKGDFDKAISLYKQSLQVCPDQREIILKTRKLLLHCGKSEDAYSTLSKYLSNIPESYSTKFLFAQACIMTGRLIEAETCLHECIRLMPSKSEPYIFSALFQVSQNRWNSAEKLISKALSFADSYEANLVSGFIELRECPSRECLHLLSKTDPSSDNLLAPIPEFWKTLENELRQKATEKGYDVRSESASDVYSADDSSEYSTLDEFSATSLFFSDSSDNSSTHSTEFSSEEQPLSELSFQNNDNSDLCLSSDGSHKTSSLKSVSDISEQPMQSKSFPNLDIPKRSVSFDSADLESAEKNKTAIKSALSFPQLSGSIPSPSASAERKRPQSARSCAAHNREKFDSVASKRGF